MINISGTTKIIGFFGETYKTSKMYGMYNAAFATLGLDYVYVPFIVDDLEKAVQGIRHLGIKAVGVTIPYKIAIMPYLDALDNDARRIGAVNAVINTNGKLLGVNTDGRGALKALQEVASVAEKKVVVLGAGGSARAIAFAAADAKASLVIVNRTESAAAGLAKAIGCAYETLERIERAIKGADIVINATSVGMVPHVDASLVSKQLLAPTMVVMDFVSNPKETKLLRQAREQGCEIVHGDRMLFWQGVLKFQAYTSVEPPTEVMERALNNSFL
jgi:shikimate dehydrogenase